MKDFSIYESVETPTITLDFPLQSIDIDWADGISDTGIPLIPKRSLPVEEETPFYKQIENQGKVTRIVQPTYKTVPTKGNSSKAMQFFMGKGLTAIQAAGIVGNLMHESGLKTGIIGDRGTSFGIAQWHDTSKGKGRWTNLKQFAKTKGTDASDFQTQLEFVWHELSSNRTWLNSLLNTSTIYDSTKSFMRNFERPGVEHLESRIRHAKSLIA